MPKKFEPCLEYEEFGYWSEHPSASMRESRTGTYVKLETFNHTVAQLDAQIERLKKHIKNLEKQNEEPLQDPRA